MLTLEELRSLHVHNMMEIVRKLVSLHNKVRQQNNKPLSEYILDVAYGGIDPKNYYLDKDHREELLRACNVVDQGYDFSDLNSYEHFNNLNQKPTGDNWVCVDEQGLYFCYSNTTPDWLTKRNDQRKEHRAKMQARKDAGFPINVV